MKSLQLLPTPRLRQLRQELGLRPIDLAFRYDRSTHTIHRWEIGHTSIPDRVKADLSNFFGVSVGYLMGLEDDEARADWARARFAKKAA